MDKQLIEKFQRENAKPLTNAAIIGLVTAVNGRYEYSPLTLAEGSICFHDKTRDRYFYIAEGSTTVDVFYRLAEIIYAKRY